jgi:aminopeptidase N
VTFHIEFSVTVPTLGGNYYYGIFGYNDSILSLAHSYPTILVYNEQGWNNQEPDLDGDPLFSDTSFYLVSINAPQNLTLVASGIELSRTELAGRQQVLYADGPARDFYLAASSELHKQSEKKGEVIINSYTLSRFDAYAQTTLDIARAAIDDFSQRYAPYPYTEFDIAPIVTSAGGVEFPGMTVVAEDAYNSGDFLEVVVTHEVGHQWFYNLVGNETQRQPWLDESLAEFVTWQYYLDEHGQPGAQAYQNEIQGTWDSANDKKIPIGEPVSSYTSQEYVAIVYGRGPFFFLALRQQIGQTAFDRLMYDYAHEFAWKIATTDSFKQLAEQHCACDLTPLFSGWVYP